MAAKDLIVDLSQIDLDTTIADADEIAKLNPQRFEMAQLTAVVYENLEDHTCVGYKQWIRYSCRTPFLIDSNYKNECSVLNTT